MTEKKTTFLSSAFAYVAIGFLPVAANFLLAPVYAAFMPPAEYALIGLATLFQAFVTFFLSLSLDSAFSKIYFDFEKKSVLRNAVMSTLLLTVIAASAVVTLTLAVFGNRIFSTAFSDPRFTFSRFGYWVILTTFGNVVFLFFALLYRNEGRLKKFITINLLFFVIPVCGTLLGLIALKGGAEGAVIGRAVGSFLFIASVLAGFFVSHPPVFKKKYFRIALRFALPIIPYQLMFAGFSNIDRLVMEHNFTAHDFGVYNFAIMIAGVIPVFISAFGNATTPLIFRELANSGDLLSVRHYNYLSVFAGTAVICMCTAFAVPVMRVFLNNGYRDADAYIGTLLLSFLPYLHYLIYNTSLFFHGKTFSFPVIAFLALAAGLLFDFYFIHILGIWAVCLSLYFIRFIQGLGGYFYNYKYGFHKYIYIKHGSALLASLFIIAAYNIFLGLNFRYKMFDVALLNFLPLLLFIGLCFTVYKKQCTFLVRGFRKEFKSFTNRRPISAL